MIVALGKKMFLSVFVSALMHLQHLPEGNRSNISEPGCDLSILDDILCPAEAVGDAKG